MEGQCSVDIFSKIWMVSASYMFIRSWKVSDPKICLLDHGMSVIHRDVHLIVEGQ